jgi:hypothetical protein
MSYGPGYKASTSFQNAVSAPYFGYQEPFMNASEWWYPVADSKYQSPGMLQNFKFGRRSSKGRKGRKRSFKGLRMSRKLSRKSKLRSLKKTLKKMRKQMYRSGRI